MTDQLEAQDDPCGVDALLDIIPEPGVRIDATWTITYLNRAARQLWGQLVTVGTDLRAHPLLQQLTTPTGRPVTLAASPLADTLDQGVSQQDLEFVLWLPKQEPRQIRISSTPVRRAGTVYGAILIVQPITTYSDLRAEAAVHNRTLQALNDLATQLQRINTVGAVCEAALDGMLPIIEATRGFVMLTDDTRRVFHMHSVRNVSDETVQLADNISYDVPSANNTSRQSHDITIVHPEQAAPVSQTILSIEGVQTAVTVPLLHDARVIGVLSYLVESYRDLTGDERAVLRTGATYIADALERARLYEQAEAERARLARILEQLPVGLYIAEGEATPRTLRWTFINEIAQRQLSAPSISAGVVSETFSVYYPDGRPYREEDLPVQYALWSGECVVEQEMVFRYHNGEERTFSATTSFLRTTGDTHEVVEVLQDITERKRLEEQVRRQAATTQAEYERLATVIANIDISLALLDARGHIQLVNDTWLRRRSETRERVLGRRYADLTDNPTVASTQPAVDRVLTTGEPTVVHDFLIPGAAPAPDIYTDWSILPLRAPDGAITGALNISVDVTEKVQIRREIEAQRTLLETTLEAAPVGIALLDREMHLINFNSAWATMVGYEAAEHPGQPIHQFGPQAEMHRTFYAQALEGATVSDDNVAYPRPDGTTRYYNIRYQPVRNPAGRIIGVISTTVDVTDAVQAHQALEIQQARTASIIADSPIGLSFFDRDMRVLTLNAEYARIAHFDLAGAVGQVLYDLAPGTEGRRALHERVLAGEPVDEDNVAYQYPGEETRYYDIRYRPVRREDGAITGILSAVTDVTDKVLAQQELEAQSGLMETMVAATPIGIAFFDRAMRAISLNVEWARMTGMDFATARGQHLYEALPTMREQEAAHQRALGGEAVDLDDVRYYLPGYEHPRHYEVHFRPIWDKDGAIAGILSAVSDVTARHEIDQQKDEFIALASHELKTPVTSIKGYAQSGLRTATKSGDERLMRTLRVIDEQSNRLTRLINELLDVSRTQNNTLSLYAEPFDLRRLVHEVVTNQQLTAPDFTLTVSLPSLPTPVNADAQRIEQVLVNLVQNAIKYSGESQRVDVSVTADGDEAITTVRDFGVGIPLDQQLQVFNRFFRASNVSSRHYSGLGLGLFIAHGIIERHGGRMWLQSVEGTGSTFSFALPLLDNTP